MLWSLYVTDAEQNLYFLHHNSPLCYGEQQEQIHRHAESCRDLPLIVCGDVMVTEPSAPVFVRIWAIPKTGIDKIHKIWIQCISINLYEA